jgi:hypothetical protein
MGFGGKVDDYLDTVGLDGLFYGRLVADIPFYERIAGVRSDILQVFQITGIGKLVEIDDVIRSITGQDIPDKIGADEPGTAGN